MLRNAMEPWHLAILVLVCLMLFGSKKLPEMARGLGRSARILKAEARALREEPEATAPATER
ncbi:Sec-independent protein translocase subunit TatA [Streptomyces sp. 4.24]|uniref:Sec-independent protein translocase subunit TatA n=1 Tax=Streptomyces tritrimontium TaxID=3406573 RepID=UPI003BB7C5A6